MQPILRMPLLLFEKDGLTVSPETPCGVARGAETILLVEDSPTQALHLQFLLRSAGWTVDVRTTGNAALARAAESPPDLILLDMNLPDLSGREIARHIKSDPSLSGTAVIFLTSVFQDVEDIISGLDQGADDYVLKTIHDGELVARVRACLRARRTERELARRGRFLLAINQIGNRLVGIHDLEELLGTACALLRRDLGYATARVFLRDRDELALRASADCDPMAIGDDPGRFPGACDRLASACVEARRLIVGSGRPESSPWSGVAVPLAIGSEVQGALVVARPGASPCDDGDTLALETIADLLGVAIENARIYRQMEEQATHDCLTQLLNRRALLARLDAEWSRSRRHGGPIALVSIDIDHFKAVNDRHGHAGGDEALRCVATAIGDAIRREDYAGRLGGDEFLIVLPETDAAGARDVAERLRAMTLALTLPWEDNGPAIPLSLSLGVASWPGIPAATPDELIRAADDALYRAKQAGRNRVSP